jgi:hypothetical protein
MNDDILCALIREKLVSAIEDKKPRLNNQRIILPYDPALQGTLEDDTSILLETDLVLECRLPNSPDLSIFNRLPFVKPISSFHVVNAEILNDAFLRLQMVMQSVL